MSRSKHILTLKAPEVDEFINLRCKVGWDTPDREMAKNSLQNSLFHVTARQQNTLLGMARVIGDGAMYFYVQDVVVDPDYHQQGIGHQLMTAIEGYLSTAAKKGATVGLLATKGNESFYRRYNYLERPSAVLGKGMCKFL